MSVPPAFDLQGLLAEDQWIRRLATRLAGDAHAAEDLVQETWVAALDARQCTRGPRALRPWLRGILRNLWIDARRTSTARADRERVASRDEALEPTSELVAELELRKSVAEALLALEEPYRGALYLRFFKDQSLAAIAKRQGIALSSAHERVQQGLVRLRARLDRQHGGRRSAWALGLLLLAKPAGAWTEAAEVLAMAGGLKLAASVLLIGGGVVWFLAEHDGGAARAEPVVVPILVATALPEPLEVPLDRHPERSALAAEASTPQPPIALPDATSTPALVRGRVVDPGGIPLASVAVGWSDSSESPSAISGPDGAFELEDASATPDAEILCREDGFVTLVPGQKGALGRPESWLVVAAPAAAFAGIVIGPDGTPVAGAAVAFGLKDALFRELHLHRAALERPEWRTTTGAEGSFRLADLAGGERVFLQVEADGFWMASFDLPATSAADLVLRLERSAGHRTIRGLVLDPAGAAVEGARVSAGDVIVATDEEGRFELSVGRRHGTFGPLVGVPERELEDVLSGAYLVALKPGLLPAREALAELDLAAPVVLRLGARPAMIAGHVLDAEGGARAGVVVWGRDPTPFGSEIESVGEGTTVAWQQTIEDELAGGFGERGTMSDEHGAFELGNLLERTYELMAFDPVTAELSGPWTTPAWSRAVELVLAHEPRTGRVAGRVISAGGRPLSGVKLSAQRTAGGSDAHAQPPPLQKHSVTTDAEGRFEFAELALEGTRLLLEDPRILVRGVKLAEHADPEHLELVEPVLCELQVELASDPDFADAVHLLDGEGRELETMESFGNGWSMGTEARISDGFSPVLLVKETAETLVLYKKQVEVLRRSLKLEPEQRTVIRP